MEFNYSHGDLLHLFGLFCISLIVCFAGSATVFGDQQPQYQSDNAGSSIGDDSISKDWPVLDTGFGYTFKAPEDWEVMVDTPNTTIQLVSSDKKVLGFVIPSHNPTGEAFDHDLMIERLQQFGDSVKIDNVIWKPTYVEQPGGSFGSLYGSQKSTYQMLFIRSTPDSTFIGKVISQDTFPDEFLEMTEVMNTFQESGSSQSNMKEETSDIQSLKSNTAIAGMNLRETHTDEGLELQGTIGGLKSGEEIALWIIGDKTHRYELIPVNDPDHFLYTIPWNISDEFAKKTVWIYIQHPGEDGIMSIYPDNPLVPTSILYENLKEGKRAQKLAILTGSEALSKDEIYEKLKQLIIDPGQIGVDDVFISLFTEPDNLGETSSSCASLGYYCMEKGETE